MLAKDLIKLLEEKIQKHEPSRDVMGELEIVVDQFDDSSTWKGLRYVGYSPNIKLEFDMTNGNYIISGFVEEKA
jgi:hypothetical protein